MAKLKRRKRKNYNQKPIAHTSPVELGENLPFPIVHYPGHYGSFLGFQATTDSDIVFCGCFRNAIENFFIMKKPTYKKNVRIGLLEFPSAVLDRLEDNYVSNFDGFKYLFHFEDHLCHECNDKLPYYRYCHEFYGSTFRQTYGWYINKQAYDFGVNPHHTVLSGIILVEKCPQDFLDLIKIPDAEINNYFSEYRKLSEINEFKARYLLSQQLEPAKKQHTQIMQLIEDIVREKFGHKKIGEAWVNETILYHIVCSLFPNKKVLRHFRPSFLKGLELDIFIPDDEIGIEYQGIQHYEPIEHWGGNEALARLQDRDKTKAKLCAENNVRIIYFHHFEILSEEFVLSKLNSLLG